MNRIPCSKCGKSVSTEVPDETIVRAWVECPECTSETKDKTSILASSFHPLTCGGNRHDDAHVAYQKEHGGDFGELVSTPKGLMCPVPGCGYKQNWTYDDDNDGESPSDAEIDERLTAWIAQMPKNKLVPLVKELLEMLVEQELVSLGLGVPYHYHTGEPLVK